MTRRPVIIADWPGCMVGRNVVPTPEQWRTLWGFITSRQVFSGPADTGDQVVILGPGLAEMWGMTATQVPAVPQGWHHGTPGPWVTFGDQGDRRHLYVGVWPLMRALPRPDKEWPLFAGLLGHHSPPALLIQRFELWETLTGVAYRGTPGVAGTTILRHLYPASRPPRPRWLHVPASPALERAGIPEVTWRSPLPDQARWRHTWDRRGAYMASAGCVEVCPGELHHDPTGADGFDPRRNGWWRVDADPWTIKAMPDPLLRMRTPDGAWCTTDRLRLLTELHDEGVFGGFTVLESWTGKKYRLFREWGELLRDTSATASKLGTAPGDAVAAAAKAAYRSTTGLMQRTGGAIHRPDWRAAIADHSGVTVWRAAWNVGKTEGRWPTRLHVDALIYASDEPDHEKARPAGLPDTPPGQYKPGSWRHIDTTDTTIPVAPRPRAARVRA